MHELSACVVQVDGQTITAGLVEEGTAQELDLRIEEPLGYPSGTRVTVVVLDEVRGMCTYAGVVGAQNEEQVAVVGIDLESMAQRRTAARARVHIPLDAVLRDADDEPVETFRLTVLDISAGGLAGFSERELRLGAVVSVPLLDDEFVAQVVRVVVSASGYRYGMRFTGTTTQQTEAVFRFVLRTQREQRRSQVLGRGGSLSGL